MIAWASLPIAILPSGTRTAQTIPALTAYAAALAEVLPVDAQMTARAPASAALLMAMVIPRSLKDPVGLAPSYFNHTWHPVMSLMVQAYTRGVPPSRSVTTGVASLTGSQDRYSSMSPRH